MHFIELLKNIKGPKAGENLHLEPWQCFFITTVFGWKKTENDKRRFNFVYLEIPRGNGKSTLSSAVALYMLCADGELSADVYSFATTRDRRALFLMTQKRWHNSANRNWRMLTD